MRKIKFLHIIVDDKFFDGVRKAFDSDERCENRYVLFNPEKDYHFKYIKNTDNIEIWQYSRFIHKEEKRLFQETEYDVVYFHSFRNVYWHRLRYIPKDKITIWWAWGFDIYSRGKTFLNMELYKPETKLLKQSLITIKGKVTEVIMNLWSLYHFYKNYNYLLDRLDYFQPVLPIEYQLMVEKWRMKAKPFYPRPAQVDINESLPLHASLGSIFIGNSATFSNNHLDIWSKILDLKLEDRKFVIPASYGDIPVSVLKQYIKSEKNEVLFMEHLIPYSDYQRLLSECSYMIIGVLRQQAIGNVLICLKNGVKLFLYKDSLVYQFLNNNGFVVFTIEEITKQSLETPLSEEEMRTNVKAYKEYFLSREVRSNEAFEEIANFIENKYQLS